MRPGPDRRLVRFAGRVPALERPQAAEVPGRAVRPDRIRHRGQRHRGDRTRHGEPGELKSTRVVVVHGGMIASDFFLPLAIGFHDAGHRWKLRDKSPLFKTPTNKRCTIELCSVKGNLRHKIILGSHHATPGFAFFFDAPPTSIIVLYELPHDFVLRFFNFLESRYKPGTASTTEEEKREKELGIC